MFTQRSEGSKGFPQFLPHSASPSLSFQVDVNNIRQIEKSAPKSLAVLSLEMLQNCEDEAKKYAEKQTKKFGKGLNDWEKDELYHELLSLKQNEKMNETLKMILSHGK